MIEPRRQAHRATFIGALLLALFVPHAARAGMFSAMVVGAGNPIVGSTVTVYAAGSSAAAVVGSGQTDSSGALSITISNPSGSAVLYAIATGGDAGHGTNPAIALMSAFGTASNYTSPIVINELTTVASMVPQKFHPFRGNHFRTFAGTSERRADGDQPGRPIRWSAVRDKHSG
jgi:hypothetical protein